jgi:hypothetical protein
VQIGVAEAHRVRLGEAQRHNGRRARVTSHRQPRIPPQRGPSGYCPISQGQGRQLKANEQPIDTSTAAGKCFLDMLGVFAEFETNLRTERQLEVIADAELRGVYRGRKASIDPLKVGAQGGGVGIVCNRLGAQDRSRFRLSRSRGL